MSEREGEKQEKNNCEVNVRSLIFTPRDTHHSHIVLRPVHIARSTFSCERIGGACASFSSFSLCVFFVSFSATPLCNTLPTRLFYFHHQKERFNGWPLYVDPVDNREEE